MGLRNIIFTHEERIKEIALIKQKKDSNDVFVMDAFRWICSEKKMDLIETYQKDLYP